MPPSSGQCQRNWPGIAPRACRREACTVTEGLSGAILPIVEIVTESRKKLVMVSILLLVLAVTGTAW